MKQILALALAFTLFVCASLRTAAQIDSAAIRQHITTFADSLVHSYYEKDWKTYEALTHPGAAKLYGSMNGYITVMQKVRARFEDSLEEKIDRVQVQQFVFAGNSWQCVVQRTRETTVDGKKASILSYMIGQSLDDAYTWKFFDVAENLLVNLSVIMPDLSDELIIPEKKTVFDEQPAETTVPVVKSKPKAKKKTGK